MREPHVTSAGDALMQGVAADDLAVRVLDLQRIKGIGLDAFFTLASIEWSRDIATACVELTVTPRLLLNPDFVAAHCATDERLAFLLLHELAHVSLGHTRLFTRLTAAQNIAFDALINRIVLGAIEDDLGGGFVERYLELPVSVYEASASPEFLLRPPPGWPRRPDWEASRGAAPVLREIHHRLYDFGDLSRWDTVTAGEIVAALATVHPALGAIPPEDAAAGADPVAPVMRLLGTHGATGRERQVLTGADEGGLVEALPELFATLGVRGQERCRLNADRVRVAQVQADAQAISTLHDLLRRVLVAGEGKGRGVEPRARATVTPWRGRDRRAAARERLARALGGPVPLLFEGERLEPTRRHRTAAIYLDVSGSMWSLLPKVHAALVPLRRQLDATVHLFSDVVVTARGDAFDRGELATTGGTSAEPVLAHVVAAGRRAPKRVLVITDGYFAAPSRAAQRAVRTLGVQMHVAIVGPGPAPTRQGWVHAVHRI